MRAKLQKHSELKLAGRIIPHSGGYNARDRPEIITNSLEKRRKNYMDSYNSPTTKPLYRGTQVVWYILGLLGALLASALVSLNVYAADQSFCNSGANVVLYDNGSLKACQLKDDYDANNIRCKNGGSVSFYSNGKLDSCVLSAEVTIAKSKCKADGLISFYIDGKLKSCMKQDN
jgi:hypothetical protein